MHFLVKDHDLAVTNPGFDHALPGRNWPFLFVRRSRAPPWEVNIPVASIPTFKAFPADIDRRDTVFRDTLSYFFYGPRLAPWYHSRTPFTTYRTALGNARRGYGVSRSMISLSGTREMLCLCGSSFVEWKIGTG